jgi:hypothetical protein
MAVASSRRGALISAILILLAVGAFAGFLAIGYKTDQDAVTTGSSTGGKEPGSIQDQQPSGSGGQQREPMRDTNVPPAGTR